MKPTILSVTNAPSFVEGSRPVFRTEGAGRIKPARFALGIDRAFAWLRPAFAIPILALLVLLVGLQNVITIPHLKSAASSTMKVQDGDFVSLVGADTRAQGMRLFRIHRDRAAILEIDIPRANEFASYVCDVQDEAGQSLYRQRVPAHEAKASYILFSQAANSSRGTMPSSFQAKAPQTLGWFRKPRSVGYRLLSSLFPRSLFC
jgi:hypothetical protein